MTHTTAQSEQGQAPQPAEDIRDLLIIGAGIGGINLAWRLSESLPQLDYQILEARSRVGGTWDLFNYPGIRSDSDMSTFAFPFKPWKGKKFSAKVEKSATTWKKHASRQELCLIFSSIPQSAP